MSSPLLQHRSNSRATHALQPIPASNRALCVEPAAVPHRRTNPSLPTTTRRRSCSCGLRQPPRTVGTHRRPTPHRHPPFTCKHIHSTHASTHAHTHARIHDMHTRHRARGTQGTHVTHGTHSMYGTHGAHVTPGMEWATCATTDTMCHRNAHARATCDKRATNARRTHIARNVHVTPAKSTQRMEHGYRVHRLHRRHAPQACMHAPCMHTYVALRLGARSDAAW